MTHHSLALVELHEPYANLMHEAIAHCSPQHAAMALDIGCGAGIKWPWLAPHLAPDGILLGVDTDRAALAAAPYTAQQYALCGDAMALPVCDASVDLIWCIAALRLFADSRAALSEMRRVLKPNGTLVLVVAEQCWVRPRHITPESVSVWRSSGSPILPPTDGLGDELLDLAATFTRRRIGALLPMSEYHPWLALADGIGTIHEAREGTRRGDRVVLERPATDRDDIDPILATVIFLLIAQP